MAKYRLGCAVPQAWLERQGDTPLARLQTACTFLKTCGFVYAEVPAVALLALSEDELTKAAELPIEVCTQFVPEGYGLVGGAFLPGSELYAQVEDLLQRMHKVGADLLVFGEAAARHIPETADFADAMTDIGNFVWVCGKRGETEGVSVVIQPLCPSECNAINYTCEAAALSGMVGLPGVGYMASAAHMARGGESATSLEGAALPQYIHVAMADEAYAKAFVASLLKTGYTGRITVSEIGEDADVEIPRAARFLQKNVLGINADSVGTLDL